MDIEKLVQTFINNAGDGDLDLLLPAYVDELKHVMSEAYTLHHEFGTEDKDLMFFALFLVLLSIAGKLATIGHELYFFRILEIEKKRPSTRRRRKAARPSGDDLGLGIDLDAPIDISNIVNDEGCGNE
ncbi:MAG: hypothetical protein LBF61_02085 [Azoarcus sp.]|jgi:hypothetical protein|nr:hypothetical protein [Azoarcus sp.]